MQTEFKKRIAAAIKADKARFGSAAKQAYALGINQAQLSRINSGHLDKILSDAKWISIARILDVRINPDAEWHTAKTPTFKYIYAQLKACQEQSISGLLCDKADIGKTHTAKAYVRNHKNAVLIDCSQVKTKQALVRHIAKQFGVGSTGRYLDVYADLVFYLRTLPTPLIVLDEAGDLKHEAFLELKALWNATERSCGWYMMGADGLKEKIDRNLGRKKVGYTEMFSRFGKRYQQITPVGKEDQDDFFRLQVALVAKANKSNMDAQKLFTKTDGSLRRVYIELQKEQSND